MRWSRARPARPEGTTGPIIPGLLLTGAVGLIAFLVSKILFPHALAVGFEVPIAMLLGLVLANVGLANEWAMPGVRFAVKHVLGLGIVLLGLRLNLQTIAVIGADAFGLVVLTIGAACTFAVLIGRRMGVSRRVSLLIGVGTSVCGASAIVATGRVIKADDREVSFAVATITVFGTLSVFVFPLVGHALDLDVLTQGLWSGTAVPDTVQSIASGAVYSTVARDVATVAKLVRNALIVPLLLIVAWSWNRRGGDTGEDAAEATKRSLRKAFPLFLLGFLALALVRTANLVDPERIADIDVVTRACFVVALAGFGLQTRLGQIRMMGPRPFLLGFGTASLLGAGSLVLILVLGLGPARTEVQGSVDPRPVGVWTPVCEDGVGGAFTGAFVGLAQQLDERMGGPRGCAEVDEATGDTVQRTGRGVATLSAETGLATFSDGERTWSIGGAHLLEWTGPDLEPPQDAWEVPVTAKGTASGARISPVRLSARVLATGIPGAGALSAVGTFHPGGPMHDKRDFAATTRAGEILDPSRLLVASTSNFGAPAARTDWGEGAVLSLSTDASAPLVIPSDFASSGTQAVALDGGVQLYTAQAPEFLNELPNSEADTADMPSVSNPLGISINNAFGRPWFANAPTPDGSGIGVETVLDPDGRPLSEAPSARAGGVFAGGLTERDPQRIPGDLRTGAIGNAFLGASPDTSGRAVFAVATADGAVVQVHVEHGVDGLAVPGTIAPLVAMGETNPSSDLPTRVGMVFNWVPDRFLYLSDPANDAIVQLRLDDDFEVFHVVGARRLESPYLSAPIDLAPAVPEIANPAFSSNTTLAGGADLYVANRDSGTIVRMHQDGRIIAVAQIDVPGLGILGEGRLNGIAVSPDASRIWLALSGEGVGTSGSIIEIPAFGAPEV